MSEVRKSNSWAIAIAFVVLPLLYVLSNAPAWLLYEKLDPPDNPVMQHIMCGEYYRPVDWLFDETPAREPLLAWSRLWNADHLITLMAHRRAINRKFEVENGE